MRFLTYDELAPSHEVDRTLLHLAAFGGALPGASVAAWRRRNDSFADYVGLFAVERGRLVGQTFVLRIPYTFPTGTETVTGIAAVVTRPDRGRAGVAGRLLTEIHERERAAGIRYSLLWTNRSWGAHGLYERLGYRDVYSSPWAVRGPVPPFPRRPRGVRPARATDLVDIERLHAKEARGRLGFLRGPPGYLATERATGDLDPAQHLVTFRSGRALRGYARLEPTPRRVLCGELVASSMSARQALMTEVRRRSGRRPHAFQQTLVLDHPGLFRGDGFATAPSGWFVLMASRLGRALPARAVVEELGTNDPRFLCLSGDRF